MNRASARGVLLLSLLLLPAAPGTAQDPGTVLGRIQQIAEVRGREISESPYAQMRRSGVSGWDSARKNAPLHDQNLVRLLRNHVFVDLDLTDARAVAGSRSLSDVGTYLIRADAIDTLNRLEVVVQQGTMLVEDVKRALTVFAAGTRARIFGTTVLFHVNEEGTEGTLFMKEGAIGFPDFDIIAEGEGRAWRLVEGSPPVELILTASERRKWEREIQYNSRSAWRARPLLLTPSLRNPLVYIPPALLIWRLVSRNGDEGIAIPPPRPMLD